jgi:ribosomal protein L37E
VTLQKVNPQTTITCRRCGSQLETLAHVLGQCTHTKTKRIHRHDIRDFVATQTAKCDGVQVIEEPSVATSTGTLKPDLVVIHQKQVHVADVTVRHEDVGYLEQGHAEKVAKYTPLLNELAEQHQASPGMVLPVVVGTRGAIPKRTIASLQELGTDDHQSLITIALLALRSSVEIYHAFLDYNRLITQGYTHSPT